MLNVIIGMICLVSRVTSLLLPQNFTEFDRFCGGERKRENGKMGSFTLYDVCCHTGEAIISTSWTQSQPQPQPFSKELNKIAPFRFRFYALWP